MNEGLPTYRLQFSGYLNSFDRENALNYALDLLKLEKITIKELYEDIIAASLNSIIVTRAMEDSTIWKEHAMTSIARTVIECAFPYVLKEASQRRANYYRGKVMILCPEEEYHELGARMGADFFIIAGFEVIYIGCNTPMENFISAYKELQPDIVAISVANHFNLVALKRIVSRLKEVISNESSVILCGSAFAHTGKTAAEFGAQALANSYEDIMALGGYEK